MPLVTVVVVAWPQVRPLSKHGMDTQLVDVIGSPSRRISEGAKVFVPEGTKIFAYN